MRCIDSSSATEHILTIEPEGSYQREFDTFAIPDIHADIAALRMSLEQAGLITCEAHIGRNGHLHEEWEPTRLGKEDTTHVQLLGDLVGKGTNMFAVMDRITELRAKGMSLGNVAGNWEVSMLEAVLHGASSSRMSDWARVAGYPIRQELDAVMNKASFSKLEELITSPGTAMHSVIGTDSLNVADRRDDILYVHSLPSRKWLERMGVQLNDGVGDMNDFFRSLLTKEHIHRLQLRNRGEYADILWQQELKEGQLTEEETAMLAKRGIRYVVRGHDVVDIPRVFRQSNGVSTVSIETGISASEPLSHSKYTVLHAARNGGVSVISG